MGLEDALKSEKSHQPKRDEIISLNNYSNMGNVFVRMFVKKMLSFSVRHGVPGALLSFYYKKVMSKRCSYGSLKFTSTHTHTYEV